MFDTNPLNNTLAQKIGDLDSRLKALEYARQPYISDWRGISEPATAAVNGLTTFTSTTYDATANFSIGDKIRLKQGGAYEYFYVSAVAANTVTFNAGSDYATTAAAVTDLAVSKVLTPSGHPVLFNYTSVLTTDGPKTITAQGNLTARFSLVGRNCFIEVIRNTFSVSNNYSIVYDQLPFTADSPSGFTYAYYMGPETGLTAEMIGPNSTTLTLINTGNWNTNAALNSYSYSIFFKIL